MSKKLFILIFILIISCLVSVTTGPDILVNGLVVPNKDILLNFRLPRLLLALIIGAGLSISGAALQSLFRNDLASPYTLGISSVSALAASISIALGLSSYMSSISAILSSLLCLLFILTVTKYKSRQSNSYLLLLGVSIGFMCSSLIFSLQFFFDTSRAFEIQKWLAGGIQVVGFSEVIVCFLAFLISSIVFFITAKDLDLLQVGYDFSRARGVDAERVTMLVLVASGIMTGVFVSICGPIGFVGSIIPNIVRLSMGSIHRTLFSYSLVTGAIFLVVCDVLGRAILAPSELPVGVVTGLLGAPVFVYLIVRNR